MELLHISRIQRDDGVFKLLLFGPPLLSCSKDGGGKEVKGRAREEGTGGVCRLLPPADRHLHFSRLVGLESSRWWENSTITVERAALTLGCLHASLYSRHSSARSVNEHNQFVCLRSAIHPHVVGVHVVSTSGRHRSDLLWVRQSAPMDVLVPCNQPPIH